MDLSAAILSKTLEEQNLDIFSKIRSYFLAPEYSAVYTAISGYYEKYNKIPSFHDLDVVIRDHRIKKIISTLKLLEVSDLDINVMYEALIDEYTQNEAIVHLEKFIPKLPLYSSQEIKDNIAEIAIKLDEKTPNSEKVYSMADISFFQSQEELKGSRFYLGINNDFDAAIGGLAREEVLYIGGRRGSGKSAISSNIFINQYLAGNSSLYMSIEMSAKEVLQRHQAMLTGVPIQHIKNGTLSDNELLKLVKCKADMFVGAEEVVENFKRHGDKFRFEDELTRNYSLKPDNQMIIVDDRDLTLGSIDLHISKAKAKFGDKLGIVIIDYINQIVLEGGNQYDWQPQIEASKRIKNLARKHEVAIISPYQIDATGEARFSKGILDSVDISLILEAKDDSVYFKTTKTRGSPAADFTSAMDWNCLKLSPTYVPKLENEEDDKKKQTSKKSTEGAHDVW